MSDQVTGLLAACGLSLLLTPLFAALARRLGVVDRSGACDRPVVIGGTQRPVAATAVEESAGIPLLGGVAVWTAVAVAMAAITPARERGVVGVIVGLGAAMCAIGVWDDHARLRAWAKLGATFVAAGALVGMGVRVSLPLPAWLAWVLSLLWILTITHALNLLDNSDGVAPGVAAIAGLGFVALSSAPGGELAQRLGAVLAGACIGFLLYNVAPARVFLGDAGSLPIGMCLAVLGIAARQPGDHPASSWIAPLLILSVPLADTGFVVVGRLRRGFSPFVGGGSDHVAHKLARRFGMAATARLLWIVAIAAAVLGWRVSRLPPAVATLAALTYACAILAALRWVSRTCRDVRAESRSAEPTLPSG